MGRFRILRYDLPRQALIAFLAAVAVTGLIGYLINVLDQVDPLAIDRAAISGERDGASDGYEAGFEVGRLAGAGLARTELDSLLASDDADGAYRLAYDFAWNDAVSQALDRAKRAKLEVEAAFDQWEALRR